MLSPEQAAYILNMGLATLVTSGAITIKEMTEEEFKAQVLSQNGEEAEGEEISKGNSEVTSEVIPPTPATSKMLNEQELEEAKDYLKQVNPKILYKA